MSEQTSDANWRQTIDNYRDYLRFERGLSPHSIEAYLHDITLFSRFVLGSSTPKEPTVITPSDIEAFLAHIYDTGAGNTTQARVLSGVRSFFTYLLHSDRIETLPTELIDSPKIIRKIGARNAGVLAGLFGGVAYTLLFFIGYKQ